MIKEEEEEEDDEGVKGRGERNGQTRGKKQRLKRVRN